MKYYAFIDGAQKGPFDLDQLADAGVRPSTYVWSKDMDDWHRADEVEEIRNVFRRHIDTQEERRRAEEERIKAAAPAVSAAPPQEAPPAERPRLRFGLPEVEEQEDLSRPPHLSMTLAVLSLLLCFPPTGIVSVIFTYKAQRAWQDALMDPKGGEHLRRQSHEYERLAKMWLGLTVAFGVIFWTLIFSIR